VKFDATGFNLPAEHFAMRYAALLLAALALSGCAVYEDEAERSYTRDTLGIRSAFTTGDVRIITERQHPTTGQTVVCTEPSPDVAKAVSASFFSNVQASGGTGQPSGSGSLSGATAEAVAELAGRTTALIGLRDGLFQACQAYANGAIGADMYALVVSRYSQLMTTLFLGQDIASATGAAAKANSPPLASNSSPPPTTGAAQTTTTTQTGAGAQTTTTTSGANGNNSPPAVATPTATGESTPASGAAAAGAAGALARMNEDYLNLDYNPVHTLMVACINDSDSTVRMPPDPNSGQPPLTPISLQPGLSAPPPVAVGPTDRSLQYRQQNTFLKPVCNELLNIIGPKGLQQLAQIQINMVKNKVIGAAVDPMIATPAPTPAKTPAPTAGKQSSTGKCVPITNAQFPKLQAALETDGELTKGDKTDTNNLVDALVAYETKHPASPATSTCNVGQASQATLNALVPPAKKAASGGG
jgi:hypothetical protein